MAEQIAVERARSPGCPGQHTYVRRQPERTVLHHVVREHLETFLAEACLRGGGDGLPRFVERELRAPVKFSPRAPVKFSPRQVARGAGSL
jgi:hypothetical protein